MFALDDVASIFLRFRRSSDFHILHVQIPGSTITITVPSDSRLSNYCYEDSYLLNSRLIINRYIKALQDIHQYKKAEIGRRSEAVVLELTSKTWTFDIVPGFITSDDAYGKNYYLIPDGYGHWKKTDPRKDRDRISMLNQQNDGNMLNVIRIIKYWQSRSTMPNISSYLIENLVASFYASGLRKATSWVDLEIEPVLRHIATNIFLNVQDPKGIQGNINDLSQDVRLKISERALLDASKASEARNFEGKNNESAINKWREIFGTNFPRYS